MKRTGFALLLLSAAFMSCRKDPAPAPPAADTQNQASGGGTTQLSFNFNAVFNNEELVLNRAKFYTTPFGDSVNVTKFNYYISNIVLKRDDGSTWAEPESYHLVEQSKPSSFSFTINHLPEGDYKYVTFMIGVDAPRNTSGAQTGALDPANNMFWGWDNGYIFLKLEGDYKSSTQTVPAPYAMHTGGFAPPVDCVRSHTDTLTTAVHIEKGKTPRIFYHTVVDEIFKNPQVISLDLYPSVVGGKDAVTLANNYQDMFVVTKVEN